MVVQAADTEATDSAVPCPRRLHNPAGVTPVTLRSLTLHHIQLLRWIYTIAGGAGNVGWTAMIGHTVFSVGWVGPQIPWVPLGQDEKGQGQHHPHCHSGELQEAHITLWHHLCEEEVVHVAQGEKGKA